MISFDKLPNEMPNSAVILPDGKYHGIITKADMKTSSKGNEYLAITWELRDEKNEKIGVLFDNLFDSDKPLLMYKLKCFLTATDINLGNAFTLNDIRKVCLNHEAIISVNSAKDQNGNDRNQVNAFADPCYAAVTKEVVTNPNSFMNIPEGAEEEIPFANAATEPAAPASASSY